MRGLLVGSYNFGVERVKCTGYKNLRWSKASYEKLSEEGKKQYWKATSSITVYCLGDAEGVSCTDLYYVCNYHLQVFSKYNKPMVSH